MLKDLVIKSRSYRRFKQNYEISRSELLQLIKLAQFSPTGMNLQPLKFYLSNSPGENARIFPTLGWAAYLKDWGGPIEGERPSAYIIILGDKSIKTNFGIDHGIAAQSILLGATEMGLGGCMMAGLRRGRLQTELEIPNQYEILLVIALGKPIENVILE
ncbi:MAG: nitroreductase family protein, partial [Anaerolineaceae bacterium]|nr:nitroreductase family protein [Anaerolineaceae bacterium]